MKKTFLALLIVGAIAFAGVGIASAQEDPAIVKVPFQFIAGEHLLPAGTYRISADQFDRTLLTISRLDGKGEAVFAETDWTGDVSLPGRKVDVQFKNIDGHYFLALVAMPGASGRSVRLTKASAERTLVRLNLMPAEHGDMAK